MNALFVGLGGAVGAVGRYGLSLLPCRSAFPLLTLLTNLIGAVLIGFVAGTGGPGAPLLRLDPVLEDRRMRRLYHFFYLFPGERDPCCSGAGPDWPLAYMALSAGLCLAGVLAGQWLSRRGV